VPEAVQVDVVLVAEQQGIPGPPQVPQAPLAHVPVNGLHELPLLTHCPDTQQPLPLHVFPAQHALPAAPHALLPVETVLPPVTVVPPPLLPAMVPPVPAAVPPVPVVFSAELVAVPPVPVSLPELPAAED